jgi:hypothetical protein
MNDAPALSFFQTAVRELRALGITLTRLPGEYRVNYVNGSDATAITYAELHEAVTAARELAKSAPAAAAQKAATYRQPRRRATSGKIGSGC